MQYLPDPYKLDVIRFLDSAAGKALMETLNTRKPDSPDANLPHSTKLSTFDRRAGYEFALAQLRAVPHESAPVNEAPKLSPLLDPRD